MDNSRLWSEIQKLKPRTKTINERNPQQTAEKLAKEFQLRGAYSELLQDVKNALAYDEPSKIQDINEASKQDHNINRHFTTQELCIVLNNLKNTTPGEDTIPYEFYKQAPAMIQNIILNIINTSWRTQEIPEDGKQP